MSRRIVSRSVVAVLLGVATLLGATLPAAAATPAVAAIPAAKLTALQRDLGLTASGIVARLAAEADAAATRSALRGALGPSFAGAWFDSAAGRLVVATTDAAQTGAIMATGARPVVVEQGLAALDAIKDTLDAHAAAVPDSVTGWYVDPATNSVVMSATDPAAARAFAAAAGVTRFRVEHVARAPRPLLDLIGGEAIYSADDARCSLGFNATSGDTTYVITAGHCTQSGGIWSGVTHAPIGPVATSSYPGDDYGLIRVEQPSWIPTGLYNGQGQQPDEITGSVEAPVGASVCHSGSTTGYECGEVMALDQTVNYGDGDVVSGLTHTSACAEPGDSGGPFVSGSQAQGVLSGGSGSCFLLFEGDTFFQPIGEILADNDLELVTSGS